MKSNPPPNKKMLNSLELDAEQCSSRVMAYRLGGEARQGSFGARVANVQTQGARSFH